MIDLKENTNYIESQEPSAGYGFGSIDPNDEGILDSDQNFGEMQKDHTEEDPGAINDVLYASDEISMVMFKNAKTILSKKSMPEKNVFSEDVRYSQKIKGHSKIIVNKVYSSLSDYKILIDNFKKNASHGASMYLKASKFPFEIRRYATEKNIEYDNVRGADVLTKGDMDKVSLVFDSDIKLDCFVAETLFEKMEGLQGFKGLGDRQGMVFPYDSVQPLTFHMGRVSFPIDIIFCSKGEVVRIFENILPGDLGYYGSDADMVLEVRGGLSSELGILPGSEFRMNQVGDFDIETLSFSGPRDIYKMSDIIDMKNIFMKIAGSSSIIKSAQIIDGATCKMDGYKIYSSHYNEDFWPVNDNFILTHNYNISDAEVRGIFNTFYPGFKYDIMRVSSADPVLISKFAMDKFGCSECRIYSFDIEKEASFVISDAVKSIATKIANIIVRCVKLLKTLRDDVLQNKRAYEKQKSNAEAISQSKSAYRQSMRRLSLKFKKILNTVKFIVQSLDDIKDTTSVDEIIGSILVTAQNSSKFFKSILEMQTKTEDLDFFNELDKRSEEFIKVSEDLETVLGRCREFIFINILGKSLLTD